MPGKPRKAVRPAPGGADAAEPAALPRRAETRIFFGEGMFDFRLGLDELEQLDSITGVGPEELWRELTGARWRLVRVQHVLRLGLVGKGMDRELAWALVQRHCKPGYLLEAVKVAASVLGVALVGVPDDQPGEPKAAAPTPKARRRSPTAAGAGASS